MRFALIQDVPGRDGYATKVWWGKGAAQGRFGQFMASMVAHWPLNTRSGIVLWPDVFGNRSFVAAHVCYGGAKGRFCFFAVVCRWQLGYKRRTIFAPPVWGAVHFGWGI
ncbi:hypothetical protein THS27_03580 [Thalassospira sp. MCCC 1A01428]|nr:hypothetical protein THS27_03580 [Thalassospira sp. MCCC 1A01428]